ncbi:ATP-grasp domain-containing protein [uncultured Ilyobacter sp.]|uniref:ATP-grasp domain-containing protein n=1 Tax=uncultured Ilyobacter sp. TaxID=544433 RepID=UPI0029C82EB7|nr:ATP-grasp domain-containing protein [uncultured Ilyobacter sp.]
MKKVLILGVASVQMDAIIELKKMGIKTYACAQAEDGPGSKFVDHFELINFVEKDKVMEFIKANEINCIYSVGSDIAMPISSSISEELGLPYFVPSKVAEICNKKNKMREYFGNDFKGNIKYQILENKDTEIILDYPFIMKPSDSQGQRGVRLINNHDEFLENFNMCKGFSRSELVIIEEYIAGPEISVNAYMVNGNVAFIAASDREVWSEFQGGLVKKHVVPSKILNECSESNLKDLVYRAAEKLGIKNGPLYFQIKVRNSQPYIIEVTPRLDGCHMWNVLKEYKNVNLIKLTFEHLLFNNVEELENIKHEKSGYTLEFLCEKPNQKADYKKFKIPKDTTYNFNYYNDSDTIRAINGQFEKIGYFIKKD